MAELPPAPSYPNYAGFLSNLIGGLPTDYRNAQLQQGSVDVQNAFKGGVPTNPDGTPNYAAALQTLAKAGDPGAVAALGPAAQTQAWQQQAQTMSPMLGGAGGPQAAPTQQPPQAQPQAAPAPPQPQGGPTLAAMVSAATPDPAQSAKVTGFLAKVLQVDPAAPLTPGQAARAQRIMAAAKLGPIGPGALPGQAVRWDLLDSGQAASGGASTQEPRGLRNNNPGNLESNAWTASLPGYTGSDGRFAVFDSATDGNAALDRNLQSYGRQGISTPRAIAAKWAPGSEAGNNPESYGASIASALGVGQNDRVDLSDPDTRAKIAKAIARVENGPAVASGDGSAPPQGNRPIVPQVPLPKGFTDPQQAILAIDREMARLSTNPAARGQVDALADWRDRIAKSTDTVKVSPTETLVDPRTGQPVFKGPYASGAGGLSPESLDAAAEQYFQTGKLPPGMGRGIQGAATMNAVISRASDLHPDADWSERPQAWQTFQAGAAGQSLLAKRTTSLELAENEASSLIPRVRDASKAVSRTQYPTLNSIIEAAQTETGNPNVIRLGIAVESLAQTYARVLSPTGTPTAADKANAHAILEKYWSQGQIDAALDQMQLEIESAKQSLEKTRGEMGGGRRTGDQPAATPAQSATGAGASGPLPAGTYTYDPNTGQLVPSK